ncbi:MAG: signal peptidase I [Solitalea-like symbiont of Tyrophagus putrescentiae]
MYYNRYKNNKEKKNIIKEWTIAIIIALLAVIPIRMFIVEAYNIPSSSMEKTLLTGDFLLVEKLSYGPRLPITPLAVPLTHQSFLGMQAYSSNIQFNYRRIKGLNAIKHNDIVVFNYPQDKIADNIYRPIDKKENYIKRCIGLPGDIISIKNSQSYINNKKISDPNNLQYAYIINTNGRMFNNKLLEDNDIFLQIIQNNLYYGFLTNKQVGILKNLDNVIKIEKAIIREKVSSSEVFPHKINEYKWNIDNFGPLWIPAKGETIKLTIKNLPLYSLVIQDYEHNNLEVKNNKIYINGIETNQYTFKMDYYFMMGDNRHNSLDSRYWGFVPEDHIVGKPLLIWLSLNPRKTFLNKIRWSRLFKKVQDSDPNN